MKIFSSKRKYVHLLFGTSLIFFLIFEIVLIIKLPKQENLHRVSGVLSNFECLEGMGRSSDTIAFTIHISGSEQNFKLTKPCVTENYHFSAGEPVELSLGQVGFSASTIFSLRIAHTQILSVNQTYRTYFMLPPGTVVMLGIPWAFWYRHSKRKGDINVVS